MIEQIQYNRTIKEAIENAHVKWKFEKLKCPSAKDLRLMQKFADLQPVPAHELGAYVEYNVYRYSWVKEPVVSIFAMMFGPKAQKKWAEKRKAASITCSPEMCATCKRTLLCQNLANKQIGLNKKEYVCKEKGIKKESCEKAKKSLHLQKS